MPSTPANFYVNELRTALEHQSFGIRSFSLSSSTPYQAIASVTLLEGDAISVKLTIQGYTIESATSNKSSPENDTFDSIENLLRSVSHLYEGKQHDAWVGKLEELSSR